MLWEEIARRLLIHVYYPVSAVAEVSEAGAVLSVSLFDTEFGSLPQLCVSSAKEIWFFAHHPEGSVMPGENDWKHICALADRCSGVKLRVFITNEDFICREYALFLPEEM